MSGRRSRLLDFTATEGGEPRVGSVEMRRQDGRWFVVSEKTRSPDWALIGAFHRLRRHPHPALRATFSRKREKGLERA